MSEEVYHDGPGQVQELLGGTYSEDEVPSYPARIYRYNGDFITDPPYAPVHMVQVRFREANATENGDFTVYQARWVDYSDPKNTYGEWKQEEIELDNE